MTSSARPLGQAACTARTTAAMASASFRAGMMTESTVAAASERSAPGDGSTLVDFLVDTAERANEAAPSKALLGVPAPGAPQVCCPIRIIQQAENTVCEPLRRRWGENRALLVQDGAMGRDVGGDDGPAGGKIVENLQRQVTTMRPGRHQDVSH